MSALSFPCTVKYLEKEDIIYFNDTETADDIYIQIKTSKSTHSLPKKYLYINIDGAVVELTESIGKIPTYIILSEGLLFCKYINKKVNSECKYISFAGFGETEKLDDIFKKSTGKTFGQWVDSDLHKKSIIVMDETQVLFNDPRAQDLFGKIKLYTSLTKNLLIFMMASYGGSKENTLISTPFSLNQRSLLDISNLVFTRNEFISYIKKTNSKRLLSFPEAIEYLWNTTGGHIGMIKISLYKLETEKSNFNCDSDIIEFLSSSSYISSIISTRAVYENLDQDANKLLKQVIKKGLSKDSTNINTLNSNDKNQSLFLVKVGVLVLLENGNLDFSSPIIRKAYFIILYSQCTVKTHHQLSNLKALGLTGFFIQVLSKFSRVRANRNLGVSVKGKPLGQYWVFEFYRIASQMLSQPYFIHPSVGHGSYFSSDKEGPKGLMDFFVNSGLGWGIEFLIEGDRLEDHFSRFQRGGVYFSMMKKITDYLIVDFRSSEKNIYIHKDSQSHTSSHVLRVSFNQSFSTFTVQQFDKEKDSLKKIGDDIILKDDQSSLNISFSQFCSSSE